MKWTWVNNAGGWNEPELTVLEVEKKQVNSAGGWKEPELTVLEVEENMS